MNGQLLKQQAVSKYNDNYQSKEFSRIHDEISNKSKDLDILNKLKNAAAKNGTSTNEPSNCSYVSQ